MVSVSLSDSLNEIDSDCESRAIPEPGVGPSSKELDSGEMGLMEFVGEDKRED
jgi:hypothetical protein